MQNVSSQVSVGSGTSDNTTQFINAFNSDFQSEDNIVSIQRSSQTNNLALQNNLSKHPQNKQPAVNLSQGTQSFSSMMSNNSNLS